MEYRYNKLPEMGKEHSRKHLVLLTGAGISVESGLTTSGIETFIDRMMTL